MKTNQFYLFSFLFLFISVSCNKDSDPAPPSNEAAITSLTFNIPGDDGNKKPFGIAFTIAENVIENADSLPYKTDVDSLYPVLLPSNRFYSYKENIDQEDYTPKTEETFWDFSAYDSIFVRSTAANNTDFTDYIVKVKVHKVDPDLIAWTKHTAPIGSPDGVSFAKAIVKGSEVYYFVRQYDITNLYISTDGVNFPSQPKIHNINVSSDMLFFNNQFYGLNAGKLVSFSFDGENWNDVAAPDLLFDNLLFFMGGNLIAAKDGNCVKINVADFSMTPLGALPANFPTENIQTFVVQEPAGYETGYVIGGAEENRLLFRIDNLSHSWSDLSTTGSTPFTERTGASILHYDNKLWVMGGNKKVEASPNGLIWHSEDRWQTPSENINLHNQTTVEFNGSIIAIGTDGLWKGRMNKMDFKIK
ncbi:MAG: DUF6242 domain-containing protein [Prevotellaceae bacterium]|jgi:hypothetical protein|nr:DUF6242 domain-containing protein [Prevotellaceae bacterium]